MEVLTAYTGLAHQPIVIYNIANQTKTDIYAHLNRYANIILTYAS